MLILVIVKTLFFAFNLGFGLWKSRFRCLLRGLTNKCRNVVPIICATAVLHSIAQKCNEEELGGGDSDDDEDDDNICPTNIRPTPAIPAPAGTTSGNRVRQTLVLTHF